MPILARIALRSTPGAVRFCPERYISPLSGGVSIFIQRSSVLFPEPLGPKITLTSRFANSNEIPLRTSNSSYAFQTLTTFNTFLSISNHPPFRNP